jgi:tRNA(fMet)-specific endonuclease VapC
MPTSGAEPIDRLVLDASAYSYLRSGHPRVHEYVASAAVVLLPVVVVGELEAAFESGSRTRLNRDALAEFMAEPFVVTVDVTTSIARRYGEVFAMLRRAGTPLPVNDIWIAAATLDSAGHLLTFDQDFRRVPSLRATILRP